MPDWAEVLKKVLADERYSTGVAYGKPRTGHAEGNVANHLVQLEENLARLTPLLSQREVDQLRVLVHVHDTFKYWARRDSAIEDPRSHASLAAAFLGELAVDSDTVRIVQYHDEGYALWKQAERRGDYDHERFKKNVGSIKDIAIFLFFTLLDGCTPSKEHERIRWFVDEVARVRVVPERVYRALELFGV